MRNNTCNFCSKMIYTTNYSVYCIWGLRGICSHNVNCMHEQTMNTHGRWPLQTTNTPGVVFTDLEGRAGMIAVHDENNTFDPNSMFPAMKHALPPYAWPVFVRKVRVMDTTGLFPLTDTQMPRDNTSRDSMCFTSAMFLSQWMCIFYRNV